MSGPALRNQDSHHAIHEANAGEIQEAMSMLTGMGDKDTKTVSEIRQALLDLWEEKVMAHAMEEEKGLYRDILNSRPETKETLVRLSRDHQLLGLLLEKAKTQLRVQSAEEFIAINRAMLLLLEIHSDEEEKIL
ncbi:hypothetical protein Thermo_01975 [Thermoplasmatales archaeon]|nr:hypothetical protein Thermo_01975 [Thermoplasmatales archaeon]